MNRFVRSAGVIALALICCAATGALAAQQPAAASLRGTTHQVAAVPQPSGPAGEARGVLRDAPLVVLYDQTDNGSGASYTAQNFETGYDAYDAMGADDFVIPGGDGWEIQEVYVGGGYWNGFGPITSANVWFYQDAGGLPGAQVFAALAAPIVDAGGPVTITLSPPATLPSGHYWMAIQGNLDFAVGGQWGWEGRLVQSNDPGLFQNPGNGFGTGCVTWAPLSTCLAVADLDWVFSLSGIHAGFGCNTPAEGFEAGVPPSGWSVVSLEPTGPVWGNLAGCGEGGNYTNGSGDVACVSSDIFGIGEFDTELRTPVLDLSPWVTAQLTYTASYANFAGSDFFDVDISTDGGATWGNLLSWNEDHGGFRLPPGEDVVLDLAAYAGLPNVQLRWHYYDPNTGDFDWYTEIDNVALACTALLPPEIEVAPTALASTQAPDEVVVLPMDISNLGEADLVWSIGEEPGGASPAVGELLNQPPNQVNGLFSDSACSLCGTGQQSIAENFVVSADTTINTIRVWTGYFSTDTPLATDLITVNVLADAGGAPGALVYTESPIAYTRVQTGVVLFGVHEWEHTLTPVAPIPLTAGTYWIEMFNNTSAGPDDFFWETGNPDGVNGIVGSAWATTTPGATWNLDGATDLAIQLDGFVPCASPADVPWLSVSETGGTTAGGATTPIDVSLDSTGLTAGDYSANLCVSSNDADEALIAVPVALTVFEDSMPFLDGFETGDTSQWSMAVP